MLLLIARVLTLACCRALTPRERAATPQKAASSLLLWASRLSLRPQAPRR